MASEDTHYHLLRLLEDNPAATQRELAEAMPGPDFDPGGVSVGKAHYFLRGLLDKGLVKARNFRRSDNKRAYLYQLTPAGVAEKVRVTAGTWRGGGLQGISAAHGSVGLVRYDEPVGNHRVIRNFS